MYTDSFSDWINTFIMLKSPYKWEFVSIHDYSGPIENQEYIEGAIFCVLDGQVVFSYEQYDYIDQLWCYIILGLTDALSGTTYDGFFPDQPLRLLFEPKGDFIRLGVGRKLFTFPAKRVIYLLASEGKRVFAAFTRLVPSEKDHWRFFKSKSEDLLSKI